MRPLTFSDGKENRQQWLPGGDQSASAAFQEFVDQHRGDDNGSFRVEDEETALVLGFDTRTISRVDGSRTEYRLATNNGDYRSLVLNFARAGFGALDDRGPWLPDVASLTRAKLRFEFDGSVLRATHPRELCFRLEVLTRIDGREPVTVDGVTHYGFGNGAGDTVNAWFTDDGRGLVVTFDHNGELNFYEDGPAQAALYEGVPDDLLGLVRNVPETDTMLSALLPDGTELVVASGVFHFSGPCAMADGLVSWLQKSGLDTTDTGIDWLLESFLALRDFSPATVAETVAWWSIEAIEKGFAETSAPDTELTPFDQDTVDRFCKIWADSGYNDRGDVHYILFDGYTIEDAGDAYTELLGLIESLGLVRVDSPSTSPDGEVWVRTDPRIDAELEHWS
ncbi:hypothetical protein FB566_1702 [Stackebrandtia endophytica]|uniref:Uncharacterized protein n=1 Tax=Stackebrandtia endophytica TaxID=1496996 RepID=A0A543AUD1_9ACTN|nr:DUF6357 family protein [Stackebrandtia endophytica]TQL76181.1 hypothetical protein FB566_1702 [Stackebrandtia endophytica]